jgi:hypothetical protein
MVDGISSCSSCSSHSPLEGLSAQKARFEGAATRIASGSLNVEDIIELKQASLGVEAATAAVKKSDEMVGTILDLLA